LRRRRRCGQRRLWLTYREDRLAVGEDDDRVDEAKRLDRVGLAVEVEAALRRGEPEVAATDLLETAPRVSAPPVASSQAAARTR